MNNKGFTLAELLGVLVVLALIAMIAVPSVSSSLKTYKKKVCVVQLDNIIEAGRTWAADNITKLPETEESDDYLDVSLDTLMKYGYLDEDTKNPKTKEKFEDDLVVRIQKYKNKYTYKLYLVGDESTTEDDRIVVGTDYCE